MMAGQMVVREIDAPLEHVGVHGAGCALMLAGDYLHPVAATEAVAFFYWSCSRARVSKELGPGPPD